MFFWMLAMALMVGIGTIANDNRANALLVYLSKPCNKKDYLIGKWMGIFLMMMMGIFPAALFFFLYGTLSYRQFGFLSDDPWLLPKVMLIVPLVCAFHASLAVGISSLFNQGRLAGATYAGIYFITNFFTQVIVGIWVNVQQGDAEQRTELDLQSARRQLPWVDLQPVQSVARERCCQCLSRRAASCGRHVSMKAP